MAERVYVVFRWMDPEGEGVGDLEFTCPECEHRVKRESAYVDDAAGIVCGNCKTKYKLSVEVYVEEDDLVKFTRDVLGIELQPYQEEFLRQSGGELRIRILRGSQEEAMAAFEELMRRRMEETKKSEVV